MTNANEMPANTNPPRVFDTDNPAEVTRLFHECLGYLQTCKRNHHGTDFEGRNFAIQGLQALLGEPKKADSSVQELVKALEMATDQLEKAVYGDRIDTKAVNIILERKALAAFKGE